MKKAVLYARVSSKEQEREGFSIPAQIKLLNEYALKNNITIAQEFIDVETAKKSGRTNFCEMLKYLKKHRSANVVLVEKTDRLYRNFKDYVTLDEFKGLEVHLVKEGSILSENSKSHDKFIHGIKVLMAKNYIDNLSEEVKKGFQEKAEQGFYPTTPPYGYKRDNLKIIVINPDTAPYIKQAFKIFSEGSASMQKTIDMLYDQGYIYKPHMAKISKGQLERLLKNRFYTGQFLFKGKIYKGNHEPLITVNTFEQTQTAFRKDQKPEINSKLKFKFSRLLKCAECGCTITAEQKKGAHNSGSYVYYHCTNKKHTCSQSKYIREEVIEEQFLKVVKKINITTEHKKNILKALKDNFQDVSAHQADQVDNLRKEALKLENRINAIYIDKLDGKITESFWLKQHNEFNINLAKIEELITCYQRAYKGYMEKGAEMLELAENAYPAYYYQMSDDNKVVSLNTIGSNFLLSGEKVLYTYKKPFNILVKGLNCQIKRG